MGSNTIKKMVKVGIGAVLVVGGALLAHKVTNNKGKHLKNNINETGLESNTNPFRPESFSSLEQADAYETLLILFNNDCRKLYEYLTDRHEGSKDYKSILSEYLGVLHDAMTESEHNNINDIDMG